MAKEEILEGLRNSLARGDPLRKAMMSFYNAGYSKADVEEAARELGTPQIQPMMQPQPMQPVQPAQTTPIQPQPAQPAAQPAQPQPTTSPTTTPAQPQPMMSQQPQMQIAQPQQQAQAGVLQTPLNMIQKVSGYGTGSNQKGTLVTVILVFVLLALLGVLVAVFLFKNELANLFGNILSVLL